MLSRGQRLHLLLNLTILYVHWPGAGGPALPLPPAFVTPLPLGPSSDGLRYSAKADRASAILLGARPATAADGSVIIPGLPSMMW